MTAPEGPDAWNMTLVGHSDLGGANLMHINLKDHYAFVGHMDSTGTSIVDVKDPENPQLVGNIPAPANTHGHKVQIVGDTLLVNRERLPDKYGGVWDQPWKTGIDVYDISNPLDPRHLSFWDCGGGRGVHRMTYFEAPYCYVAASAEDYLHQYLAVLDLSDPNNPTEAGRWWVDGQRTGAGETPSWDHEDDRYIVKIHHGIPRDDRLYVAWWDQGMRIHDISDPTDPKEISYLDFGAGSKKTHTVCPYPGRDFVVTTDECTEDGVPTYTQHVRVVDISDETAPKLLSQFPVPGGDFPTRGGRFGPHNLHEMRPGTLQDGNTAYLTYFNAGVRCYDLSDPTDPTEIGYYIPEAPAGAPAIQLNDIVVSEDGLIYVSDRVGGGLYIFKLDDSANRYRKQ